MAACHCQPHYWTGRWWSLLVTPGSCSGLFWAKKFHQTSKKLKSPLDSLSPKANCKAWQKVSWGPLLLEKPPSCERQQNPPWTLQRAWDPPAPWLWTSNLQNHERENAFLISVCGGGVVTTIEPKLRTREDKEKGGEKAQCRCRWGTTKMEASSRCELVFLMSQRLQWAFLKMRLGSACSGALSGAAGTEDYHLFALADGTEGLWTCQKSRHLDAMSSEACIENHVSKGETFFGLVHRSLAMFLILYAFKE